ncbi:MAG TPA: STAS domain-containing protein [Chthoniobacterales bacterium]|nr:STAS domain-containing protein [Chthoniobacterales bacterium]
MNSQFDHLVQIAPPKEKKSERLPSVSVATFDHNVWIRIVGRGSFKSSIDLKEWIQPIIEQRSYNYIIDLVDCEQMDSTFMGTLAGIAQRLRAKKQGVLKVINANEVNRELMESLGLDQLFSIQRLSLGRELPPFSGTISFQEIILPNRLLSKLAYADEVQGGDGAQKLSVQELLDASITGATKQFAAEVEFGKKSNKDPSEIGFSDAVREINEAQNESMHDGLRAQASRKQADSGVKVDLSKLSQKKRIGEVVLSAHESLVVVNKTNKKKFKNLMEVMRRRLRT